MIDTLYIEREISEHPRVKLICARFPKARQIYCDRYSEVFNRKAQNFRLQKQSPALILASKHGKLALPTPPGYGIGGKNNYYFSHMLNCVYDCRYCFLQGMYQSAHYVLFVNYDDFYGAFDEICAQHSAEDVYFFSGYDCDSLALEPITGFVDDALNYFSQHSNAFIELRTKSTQVRSLLKRQALQNCIVASSLNPPEIVTAVEHKTPSLEKRLEALASLQKAGWPIGLRFDPLIYTEDYRALYKQFFATVFSHLDASKIHSCSLGSFRLPQHFFRNMVALYPEEKLFAAKITSTNKQVGYTANLEHDLLHYCREQLLRYTPEHLLHISCDDQTDAA